MFIHYQTNDLSQDASYHYYFYFTEKRLGYIYIYKRDYIMVNIMRHD